LREDTLLGADILTHDVFKRSSGKTPHKNLFIPEEVPFTRILFGEGALLGAGILKFDTFKRAMHSL